MSSARLTIVFLCVLLLSCSGGEKPESPNTKIIYANFGGAGENVPFKLSQVIDSVRYISIESSSVPIGHVQELKFACNRYYLADQSSHTIYVVDEDGGITSHIGRLGRAENEYITLQCFDVNPANGQVSIYDGASRKMVIYAENGDFVRSFRTDRSDVIRDFAVMADGSYLFYTPDYAAGSHRGAWLADSNGMFISQLITIDDNFRYGGLYPEYLYRLNDETICLMGGEDHDRIYHIIRDSVSVPYKIDPGSSIPRSLRSESLVDMNKYRGSIYTKSDYIETDGWMSVTLSDMMQNVLIFYDKKNDITYIIKNEDEIINDAKLFCGFGLSCYNRLISVVEAYAIVDNKDLREMFPDITYDSNPVLAVFYTTH